MIRPVLTAFLIALVAGETALAAGLSCQDLFTRDAERLAVLALAKSLTKEVDWQDWATVRMQSRVSEPGADGKFWAYNDVRFETQLSDGLNATSAHYLSTESATTRSMGASPRLGMRRFRKVKGAAVGFVIRNYEIRRPHWPSSFRTKLKKIADLYEEQSTYLVVEGQAWENPLRRRVRGDYLSNTRIGPDLLGTMRLIHEKDGKIPVEDYLGIELKGLGDILKVEPGNFAMANEANEIASIQLSIQILAQIQRYRAEFGKEPFFLTYADSLSERLYGAMGYRPLTADKMKVTDSSVQMEQAADGSVRVNKDDVSWLPMYATGEMLIEILQTRLKRIADKSERGSKEAAEALNRQFLSAIRQSQSAVELRPSVFLGALTSNPLREDLPEAKLHVVPRQNGDVELFIQVGREHHLRFREPIRVPYPIPEGFESRLEHGSVIRYSQGVLRLSSNFSDALTGTTTSSVQEIWIDSNLQTPRRARVWSRSGHEMQESFEIGF